MADKTKDGKEEKKEQSNKSFMCGLVMPISAIDGCPAEHWSDVKGIVTECVESVSDYKFAVKLVSEADDVGVIQKRIVQNIYNSDILICDVSGKNPNVMFELGMRLAFDKPTIIIKDDKTDYSFDTAIIEHIPYPRDLRFTKMVTFKALLSEKVVGTFRASKDNPDHSTFLKNFGKFHVANLSQDVVPADKLAVEMLMDIQGELSRIRHALPRADGGIEHISSRSGDDPIAGMSRLFKVLSEYVAENPDSDLIQLIDSDAFVKDMISRCNAPLYFPKRSGFVAALKRAVDDVAKLRPSPTADDGKK